MNSILVVLLICMFNGTVVVLFKQKFGKCLPVSLLGITLILYYIQFMFGTFQVGYIALWIGAFLFVPLAAWSKKKGRHFAKDYISWGFVAFIWIVVLFGVVDFHRTFRSWDELSHWGMMTKELLRLDTWYTQGNTRLLVHRDYPPFVSLFEMLWCKMAGGYSEARTSMALHIFSLSLLTPALADICLKEETAEKKNAVKYMIPLVIDIIYIILIRAFDAGDDGGFLTIYKDIVLALLFVYALMLLTLGDVYTSWFDFFALVLVSAALLITKQMGIAFVLIIWLYFILNELARKKEERHIRLSLARFLLGMFFVPVLTWYLWKDYIDSLKVTGQFDLHKISFETLKDILSDSYARTVQRQALNNYINALFEKEIFSTFIPMTYAAAFLLILAILLILRKCKILDQRRGNLLAVTFTCGTFGYALTMGVLYLFCYSEGEMLRLASYERYMSGYVMAEILLLTMIGFRIWCKQKRMSITQLVMAAVLVLIMTNASNLSVFIPGIVKGKLYEDYRNAADYLEANMEQDTSVFILAKDTVQSQYFINYYAEDIHVSLCYIDMLNDDYTQKDKIQKTADIIFENDYLYVKDINDNFNQAFCIYNDGNEFAAGKLYKIK